MRSSCGCARQRARDPGRGLGRAVHVPRSAEDERPLLPPRPVRSPPRSTALAGDGDLVWTPTGDPGRRATRDRAGRADRGRRARESTGARLAWVPRRAGDRGALETGCLPNLCRVAGRSRTRPPGSTQLRPGESPLPDTEGRDSDGILAAARRRRARRPGGRRCRPRRPGRPGCSPSCHRGRRVRGQPRVRETDVTRAADVVFPIAPVTDKAGMFVDWEVRPRPFDAVFATRRRCPTCGSCPASRRSRAAPRLPDRRRGAPQMEEFGPWDGERADRAAAPTQERKLAKASCWLATWKQLSTTAPSRTATTTSGRPAAGRRPGHEGLRRDSVPSTVDPDRRPRLGDPAGRGRDLPTAPCGCRRTRSATASWPTWPRPAAAVTVKGADLVISPGSITLAANDRVDDLRRSATTRGG